MHPHRFLRLSYHQQTSRKAHESLRLKQETTHRLARCKPKLCRYRTLVQRLNQPSREEQIPQTLPMFTQSEVLFSHLYRLTCYPLAPSTHPLRLRQDTLQPISPRHRRPGVRHCPHPFRPLRPPPRRPHRIVYHVPRRLSREGNVPSWMPLSSDSTESSRLSPRSSHSRTRRRNKRLRSTSRN